MAAIVITGLEEALVRCTMVQRDKWAREQEGKGDPTEAEEKIQRKLWAASSGFSMINEISAIVICRVAVVILRPHRYIFAVGSNEGNDLAMLLFGMLLELFMEACVDYAAIQVEKRHGVDLEDFWAMWRKNPTAYLGANAFTDPVQYSIAVLLGFRLIPNPIFGCL